MKKNIILISGPPRAGKTSLGYQLTTYQHRIHMDNVCLVAGIKHPHLLPPAIDPERIMDVDLGNEFQNCIGKVFHQILKRKELNILINEYVEFFRCRHDVRVVEGYALGFETDRWMELHRSLGTNPILVNLDGGIRIGESFLEPDFAVSHLRSQISRRVIKHL